jgi:hypothetical protein
MLRPLKLFLAATVFALALISASAAFAAPVAWQSMDVTQHSEKTGGVLLVSGDLPQTAKLPAEAELSVPAGSELSWIGEVLGGPSANDPEVKYVKSTANGMDVYRFTLTKGRSAQIEVLTSQPSLASGANLANDLQWTATAATPKVRLSARIPQSAKIVTPGEGASIVNSEGGYSYYSKTVDNVKTGDKLALAFTYSVPAVAPAATQPTNAASTSPVATILFIAALLVAAGFAILAIRTKLQAQAAAREPEPAPASNRSRAQGARAAASTKASASRKGAPAAEEYEDDEPVRTGPSGRAKRNLVTATIIGLLVVAGLVAGARSTKPQLAGDTITQTFSQGQPCATATIAINAPSSADPNTTAKTLFAAVQPVPSITTATYNSKTGSFEVGFCESSASEAAIRTALQPTGLITAGNEAAAPAAGAGAPPTPTPVVQ